MQTRYKVIIVISTIVVSFAAGRYSTPEKVKVETKIVEVEKKVVDDKKDKHKETKTIVVVKPDGTKETTKTTVEDTKSDVKSNTDTKTAEKEKNETTTSESKVTLSALGGLDLSTNKPIFGASLTKPVLGPLTIGIFGLSNGSCGLSLGVTF